MFSIFTHVMKPVRDTNSEPELPVIEQKEARLILLSGIYIFCYQYFGRHGLPS